MPDQTDPREHDCPACCALPCECADSDEAPETDQDRDADEAESWLDSADSREDRDSERYCDERGL